jgi:hypothetical protein
MIARFLLAILFSASILSCSSNDNKASEASNQPGEGQSPVSLNAPDFAMTIVQNGSGTLDIETGGDVAVVITQPPAKGNVNFSGSIATYQSTNPLFYGQDSFKYKLTRGAVQSNEATIVVNITAAPSGNTAMVESYANGNYVLSGWQSYSSSYGHTANTQVGFVAGGKHFGIYGDVNSYAGDSLYQTTFGAKPVDGAAGAMKDWPWKADLIYRSQCGSDATVTLKLKANLGKRPMGAILLNYGISGTGANQKLNGYQILFNGGGGSMTLSRFKNANELATAFVDRWPNTTYGTENMANPVETGPYKGWNYQRGVWPAGGNLSSGTDFYLAARYQYDPNTLVTTISYEARSATGVDLSPGVWDRVVVLNGVDSLASGGKFGLMALNYHSASEVITTDFDVTEFKLDCQLP